jgi:ABC-2 type transport system ATP-binding protein
MGRDHCIILSTHILGEAREVCDRVLIMRGGKVVMDAELASLDKARDRQTVIAAFDNPPSSPAEITLLEGVHDAQPAGGRNRYRITCTGNPAVLSLIAETASARNWGLIELAIETDTLEETYIRLTGGPAAEIS